MKKTKLEKSEVINNQIKVWYSTQTMDGNITVDYSEGQDLIQKHEEEKIQAYGVKKIAEELWGSKKVVKKDKK
jgi:hypothetical protein|tara:strand:+ start:76 stop:294 length:219 start_codon:yes stop_codon:yes gene_type:complete